MEEIKKEINFGTESSKSKMINFNFIFKKLKTKKVLIILGVIVLVGVGLLGTKFFGVKMHKLLLKKKFTR
jgi:Na+/H+ antiporter NhaC